MNNNETAKLKEKIEELERALNSSNERQLAVHGILTALIASHPNKPELLRQLDIAKEVTTSKILASPISDGQMDRVLHAFLALSSYAE